MIAARHGGLTEIVQDSQTPMGDRMEQWLRDILTSVAKQPTVKL
nr:MULTISPECIES: hypothetical protein [unclassified Anabaena]